MDFPRRYRPRFYMGRLKRVHLGRFALERYPPYGGLSEGWRCLRYVRPQTGLGVGRPDDAAHVHVLFHELLSVSLPGSSQYRGHRPRYGIPDDSFFAQYMPEDRFCTRLQTTSSATAGSR